MWLGIAQQAACKRSRRAEQAGMPWLVRMVSRALRAHVLGLRHASHTNGVSGRIHSWQGRPWPVCFCADSCTVAISMLEFRNEPEE